MNFRTNILLWILGTAGAMQAMHGISTYTNGGVRVGEVELVNEKVSVDVHSWYLDCEHTFEIATDVSSEISADQKNSLVISGAFELPASAVIVGAIMWDGEKVMDARLCGPMAGDTASEFSENDSIAQHTTMSITKASGSKSSRGNQKDSDVYRMKISRVKWGWNKKYRIRYLVPQREFEGIMTMPVFAQLNMRFSRYPSFVDFSLSGSEAVDSAIMSYSGIEETLALPVKRQAPNRENSHWYANSLRYTIAPKKDQPATVTTSFPDGHRYDGSYLMHWGNVPDQLQELSDTRTEVLFVWKWFGDNSYLVMNRNGYRNLLNEWDITRQAHVIRGTSIALGRAGSKVGLIHDRDSTHRDKSFDLSYPGSDEFASMVKYLERHTNSAYLLSVFDEREWTNGDWRGPSHEERLELARKGAEDFTLCMHKAFSMLSQDDNTLRHIIVVTVGPSWANNYQQFYSNPGFQNVSFTANGSWNGVPVAQIEQQYPLSQAVRHNSFRVPKMKGYNYIVTMQSGSVTKELELISYYKGDLPYIPAFSFAGYSDEPWETTVKWRKYEKTGTLMGTYIDTPHVVSVEQDSSLAKIWAGSEAPFTDIHENWELGSYFGIVHDSTSAVVLGGDSSHSRENNSDTVSVSFFLDEDFIEKAVHAKKNVFTSTALSVHIQVLKGKVLLNIGSATQDLPMALEILNLKGQIVFRENYAGSPKIVEISKSTLPSGTYICSLRGQSRTLKRIFTIY